MTKKSTKAVAAEVQETTLSEGQLVRAARNEPTRTFTLGERVFVVKDLEYDDVLAFSEYLGPFLDGVAARLISQKTNISVPQMPAMAEALTVSGLLRQCGRVLPEMAQIVCRQTDPDITIEEVKKLAKGPTALLVPVMAQIEQNKIAQEFASFFHILTTTLTTKYQSQS